MVGTSILGSWNSHSYEFKIHFNVPIQLQAHRCLALDCGRPWSWHPPAAYVSGPVGLRHGAQPVSSSPWLGNPQEMEVSRLKSSTVHSSTYTWGIFDSFGWLLIISFLLSYWSCSFWILLAETQCFLIELTSFVRHQNLALGWNFNTKNPLQNIFMSHVRPKKGILGLNPPPLYDHIKFAFSNPLESSCMLAKPQQVIPPNIYLYIIYCIYYIICYKFIPNIDYYIFTPKMQTTYGWILDGKLLSSLIHSDAPRSTMLNPWALQNQGSNSVSSWNSWDQQCFRWISLLNSSEIELLMFAA